MPEPALILILEQGTWGTAGLQHSLPDWQQRICGFSLATDLLQAAAVHPAALLLIDLGSTPEQGSLALLELARKQQLQRALVLLDRTQHLFRWEVLASGCLLVREKPFSQQELAETCQQILMRQVPAALLSKSGQ